MAKGGGFGLIMGVGGKDVFLEYGSEIGEQATCQCSNAV